LLALCQLPVIDVSLRTYALMNHDCAFAFFWFLQIPVVEQHITQGQCSIITIFNCFLFNLDFFSVVLVLGVGNNIL
jgi:hypothetical protein